MGFRDMGCYKNSALIGLDLPLAALVDVAGRRRKIITCIQDKNNMSKP
jgi:hypothetical protein